LCSGGGTTTIIVVVVGGIVLLLGFDCFVEDFPRRFLGA
jgi:hypothetical protein